MTQNTRKARPTAHERFWVKVEPSPTDDCLLWVHACKSDGYGVFHVHTRKGEPGQFKLAHVFAYEEIHGPVPEGYQVDHVYKNGCRHRNCVLDAHLEAVTHRENQLRKVSQRREVCKRFHPRTPENMDSHGGCKVCRRITSAIRRERKRAENAQLQAA